MPHATIASVHSYREIESAYTRDNIDSLSAHEALSLVEFQLRLVAFVGVRAHLDAGGGNVRIGRSPGMGSLLALLRQIERDASIERRYPSVFRLVSKTRERFYFDRPIAGPGLENFKLLRDHLMHSGALPGASSGDAVSDLSRSLAVALGGLLDGAMTGLSKQTSRHGAFQRALLAIDGELLDLWPLVVAHADDELWHIYSSYADGVAWYNVPRAPRPREPGTDDQMIDDLLSTYLRTPAGDNSYGDFVASVRQDLGSFSSRRSEPVHWDDNRDFTMVWERATSAGDELRHDRFRLGPDDTRQWWDPDLRDWRPYRDLVRALVNWPVLNKRLIDLVDEADARERARLRTLQLYVVPPRLHETDMNGVRFRDPSKTAAEFSSLLKSLSETRGPNTTVVFIQGPAGIGKTRCLRYIASTAMRSSGSKGDDGPLFLYIQTGGVSLLDLDQVVNAAVSGTLILTTEVVKTLARNGLLVIVIDGFDELLGGRSYDSALEALRPWFDALGGRGVMVLSARTAYFLTHYRESLLRKASDSSFGVTHRVFELERWTSHERADFANHSDIPPNALEGYQPKEQDLLSLPFFAGVVAQAYRSGAITNERRPVADLLLAEYLDRESEKLAQGSPPNTRLMSREELEAFFMEIAELLATEPQRGVDDGLVRLAGGVAIGGDLETRPGLARRLSVLCGLETQEVGGGLGARVAFGHELYFDYFYALVVERQFQSPHYGRLTAFLSETALRPWPAGLIVNRLPVSLIRAFLERDPAPRRTRSEALAVSRGALFEALLRSGRDVGDLSIVIAAAHLGTLDLVALPRGAIVVVEDCIVGEVLLSADLRARSVRFRACSVQNAKADSGDFDRVSFDEVSVPEHVLTRTELVDGRERVCQLLRARHAELSFGDTPTVTDEGDTARFRYFLHKMRDGAVLSPVVEADTRLPNDQRLRWANSYPEEWRRFVDALVDSDAAKLRVFAASGTQRMARLKLKVSLQELEAMPPTSAVARAFWFRAVRRHQG